MVSKKIPVLLGLIIIFISFITWLFIFDKLGELSTKCKENPSLQICSNLSSNKILVFILVLIIAGIVLIMLYVTYILITLR
ncbi:MAG: hypothetical protein QW641_00235 [Candidatus Aenigmatarchaeota archaeon]